MEDEGKKSSEDEGKKSSLGGVDEKDSAGKLPVQYVIENSSIHRREEYSNIIFFLITIYPDCLDLDQSTVLKELLFYDDTNEKSRQLSKTKYMKTTKELVATVLKWHLRRSAIPKDIDLSKYYIVNRWIFEEVVKNFIGIFKPFKQRIEHIRRKFADYPDLFQGRYINKKPRKKIMMWFLYYGSIFEAMERQIEQVKVVYDQQTTKAIRLTKILENDWAEKARRCFEKHYKEEHKQANNLKRKKIHPFKKLSHLVSNAHIFTKKDIDLKSMPIINTSYRNFKENELFKIWQKNNPNNDRCNGRSNRFETADQATASKNVKIYTALTTPLDLQ